METPPPFGTSPAGIIFGSAFFTTLILGWFWIGELIAVGAGWQPLAEAAQQFSQAVRP